MSKTLFTLTMIAILALISIPGIQAAYQVGDTVANFTITDTEGKTFVLDDYLGMAIFINFWTNT